MSPLLGLALVAALSGGPGAAPVDPSTLQRDLEQARLLADSDDELEGLERALAALHEHAPVVAASEDLQQARAVGYLTLARGYLARNDRAAAGVVVDEALRVSRGADLPSSAYGPTLHAFVQERLAARPADRAILEVRCEAPCRVYLDETAAREVTSGLVPGVYRLWVESEGQRTLRREVKVAAGDSMVPIHYNPTPAPAPVPAEGPTLTDRPEQEPGSPPAPSAPADVGRVRVAPRWAEIVGVSLGVGLAVTGAVLTALGPTCVEQNPCEQLRRYDTAGIPILAVGSALAVAGSVTLAVDEVRVGRIRGRTASIGWQMRF